MNQELKPCPFCGMQSELSWEDTIHQSGEAWKPQKIYAGKQYLMLYDSGYVCGVGVLSAGKVSRT